MIYTLILAIVLGIVIPIILPLIPNVELSIGDQIVIGILSASIPMLVEIEKNLYKLSKLKEAELARLRIKNEFDGILSNISEHFSSFSDIKDKGIFSSYFMKEIHMLDEIILEAAERHKFIGRVQHVVTDEYILSCFGKSEKHWRLTWIVDSIDMPIQENDDSWNVYFTKAVELLGKGKIKHIDVLFITDKDEIYNEICNQSAECGLRKFVKGYTKVKFKIVKGKLYDENYKNAFRSQIVKRDIGIYGDNLLFIYDVLDDDYGEYNENSKDISTYLTFFETTWNTARNIKND